MKYDASVEEKEYASIARSHTEMNKSASSTNLHYLGQGDIHNISGTTQRTNSVMKTNRRQGRHRRGEKKQKSFRNTERTEMTMMTRTTNIKEEKAEESTGRKSTQQEKEKEEAAVPAGRREVTVEAIVEDGNRERVS